MGVDELLQTDDRVRRAWPAAVSPALVPPGGRSSKAVSSTVDGYAMIASNRCSLFRVDGLVHSTTSITDASEGHRRLRVRGAAESGRGSHMDPGS